MPKNPRLNNEIVRRAHVGGFAPSPYRTDRPPSVRIILVGIMGPPRRWKPVYQAVEEVCRPMIFPFSPDQPEKDKTVAANVVEYVDVASDLKGNVIAGDPTIIFCLPGIDRNRRVGIFAEALPRVLSHHDLHRSLLYFRQDGAHHSTGIQEAKKRGTTAHELEGTADDFQKESFQEWWADWLIQLDPMKNSE